MGVFAVVFGLALPWDDCGGVGPPANCGVLGDRVMTFRGGLHSPHAGGIIWVHSTEVGPWSSHQWARPIWRNEALVSAAVLSPLTYSAVGV